MQFRKKMSEKHYLRKDGNGGWNVSNSIALIALIVVLLSTLGASAFGYGQMSIKVSAHDNIINSVWTTVNQHETKIAVFDERLENIDNNVQEILKRY